MAIEKNRQQDKQDLNSQLRTLNNRNYLLLSLIFFISLLAVAIFGIIPKFSQISDLRAELKQDKKNLATIQNKLARIEDLVNDPEFAQADTINRLLSSTNPFLEILYALNELGKENNITFTSYEYAPGLIATPSAQFLQNNTSSVTTSVTIDNQFASNNPSQQAQGFSIAIKADGAYANIAKFLQEIEHVAPLSSVAYAEIDNSLLGYASADLDIIAHYFNPNVIAQLDEPLPTLSQDETDLLNNLDQFRLINITALDQADIIGGKVDLFGNITFDQEQNPQ